MLAEVFIQSLKLPELCVAVTENKTTTVYGRLLSCPLLYDRSNVLEIRIVDDCIIRIDKVWQNVTNPSNKGGHVGQCGMQLEVFNLADPTVTIDIVSNAIMLAASVHFANITEIKTKLAEMTQILESVK